jgi:kynureninase
MAQLSAKSRALATLFIDLVEAQCGAYGVELVGPRPGAPRGSHVSFRHPHGYAIMQALIDRGVIGDFRAPDIMRFGLTPLYLSFTEVARAVDVLAEVLRSDAWRAPAYQVRRAVT